MKAFVGLGANLGDPQATLAAALRALAALPDTALSATSSIYRSAPVDAQGPDYFNAVAALDTELDAVALLQALHGVEQVHGRHRPYPNAPRTLDLDLLLYGDAVLEAPDLCVPHPRLQQRAFVLLPLLELEPLLRHPILGPLSAWLAGVADQPITRLAERAPPTIAM